MSSDLKKLTQKAEKRGLERIVRHVFFCGQSGCCEDKDEAKASIKVFNRALKTAREGDSPFELTSVDCLKLCRQGPIVVVYPEGVWYARVTPEIAEKIVEKHLKNGEVVEEAVFMRREL